MPIDLTALSVALVLAAFVIWANEYKRKRDTAQAVVASLPKPSNPEDDPVFRQQQEQCFLTSLYSDLRQEGQLSTTVQLWKSA